MGSISSDTLKGGPYLSLSLKEGEEDEDEKDEKRFLMKNTDGDDYKEKSEKEEYDTDFEPIEHPMEPLEEDKPIKCPNPMLDSSILSIREITMMLSYFS